MKGGARTAQEYDGFLVKVSIEDRGQAVVERYGSQAPGVTPHVTMFGAIRKRPPDSNTSL